MTCKKELELVPLDAILFLFNHIVQHIATAPNKIGFLSNDR
jgi:hypothetical protein